MSNPNNNNIVEQWRHTSDFVDQGSAHLCVFTKCQNFGVRQECSLLLLTTNLNNEVDTILRQIDEIQRKTDFLIYSNFWSDFDDQNTRRVRISDKYLYDQNEIS